MAGKHFLIRFKLKNGLKQGDALSPFLFKSALQCVIRYVQENHVGLKLNWTHQLMVYTDDVNLLGDNTDAIKNVVAFPVNVTIPIATIT
jgi:hypothetical protein